MRRVWDACEGKAEETFATNLKKAAEAAAARAKEDPATFAEEVSMTTGPDPEIRDARQRAAAWRRRKAELVKAAQEKRRRKQRDEVPTRRPFFFAWPRRWRWIIAALRHRRDASIHAGHRQGRENLEPDGREVRGPPREDHGSSGS